MAAIRQQQKPIALSYLRSRMQLEGILTQRLGSLEILQSTLMRVESAAEDIHVRCHHSTCLLYWCFTDSPRHF
jgi:charged multivesicular body protein 7